MQKQKGIYRVSGSSNVVNELKGLFNQDDQAVQLNSDKYTPHDVASTLKLYFRELPDPLLTSELYTVFVQVRTSQRFHHAHMCRSVSTPHTLKLREGGKRESL